MEGSWMSVWDRTAGFGAVFAWTLGLVSASCFVGCSSDTGGDDEGKGRVESGVEGSKTLGEIDQQEAETICTTTQGAFATEAILRGYCVLDARDETGDLSTCSAAVEECMQDAEPEFSDADVAACADDLFAVDCELTVEELDACTNDRLDAIRAVGRGGCEDVIDADSESLENFVSPASCERIADRCPEFYGGSSSASGASGGGGPVAGITGELDGESIRIGSDDYVGGGGGTDNGWFFQVSFEEAELRMWGEKGETNGLLLMPEEGAFASQWLCLGEVQVESEDEPFISGTWESTEVSSLGACGDGDGSTLAIEILGTQVEGTLGGEPVSWTSNGYACSESVCSFKLYDGDRSLNLRVAADGEAFDLSGTTEVSSAALLDTQGSGGVACGGAGTFTDTDEGYSIVIDNLAAFRSCPGEALEGQLSGAI